MKRPPDPRNDADRPDADRQPKRAVVEWVTQKLDAADADKSPYALADRELAARVVTFRAATWFAMPEALSPLQCAARGWRNSGDGELECAKCGAKMLVEPDGSRGLVDEFVKQLAEAHRPDCLWRLYQCPAAAWAFPQLGRRRALALFRARAASLEPLPLPDKVELGGVSPEDLSKLAEAARVGETAAVLAVSGWAAAAADPPAVACLFCERVVVLSDLDPAVGAFDARVEHRAFCPWVRPASAQLPGGRICGMELLVGQLVSGSSGSGQGTVRRSLKEAVLHVRRLLGSPSGAPPRA